MHAYREKTVSRGIGCVTEPAWQSRSRNLMLVSHMRIGFEIHTEGVLYNPWVLLHLRTLTWLARKTHLNLNCNVEPFLRDGKKQQWRCKLQRACTSRQIALLPNCIALLVWATKSLPPQFPFFTHWSSVSRSVEFSLRSRTRSHRVFEPEAVGPAYLSLTDFPLPSHGSVAFACGCTSHGTERRKAAP